MIEPLIIGFVVIIVVICIFVYTWQVSRPHNNELLLRQ